MMASCIDHIPSRNSPNDAEKCRNSTLSNTILFNKWWAEGVFPETWKKENRIFIPKQDKPSYNKPKAYRSLALTSTTGKVFERLGQSRLHAFMKHNGLFDPYQYAYQRNRNITQALLMFSLQVLKGLHDKENTIAVLIDLAGAYNMIRRQGLVYMLQNKGL